jgi:hypothetical protein
MTSRDFAYWLQGFFELENADQKAEGIKNPIPKLSPAKIDLIQKHLNMVFYHEIDPSMGDKTHQGKLSEIHHGNTVDLSDPMVHSTFPSSGLRPSHSLIARC